MRQIAAAAIFALAASPSFASGGLSCTGDDDKVKFQIESGVTSGMGGPVFNFRGTVEILDTSVAEDLRRLEFAREHLPQYWLDNKRLSLHLYRERDADKPHGYVDLVIETQPGDDEGLYGGQYEISVFDTVDEATVEPRTYQASGTVSCFVE